MGIKIDEFNMDLLSTISDSGLFQENRQWDPLSVSIATQGSWGHVL